MTGIINLVQENIIVQYFAIGSVGSVLFDATLYFNKDLGLIAEKKKIRNYTTFGFIYILCQTIYSALMGGMLGAFVNHSLWIAFAVGFFSSGCVTFVVKTILTNSMKRAFWIAIGKLFFETIGSPAKKILDNLETIVSKKKNGKE